MVVQQRYRSIVLGALLCAALVGEGVAQTLERCPPGKTLGMPAVEKRINARAGEIYVEVHGNEPLTVPQSEQVSAPSNAGTSTSLVEGAAFPSLLALALDHDLIGRSDGAFTLNLSPFVIIAARDPTIVDDPGRYNAAFYGWLRRWGATASLGGKGEAFDRDGDGEADEALEAATINDIVTWEVRYRLFGSRDRKDWSTLKTLLPHLQGIIRENQEAWDKLLMNMMKDLARIADPSGDIPCDELEKLLAETDRAQVLLNLAESEVAVDGAVDAWRKVDRKPLLTLVAGGVEREPEFGPNERLYALRGSWRSHTLNLEFSTEEGLAGAEDPETWKLAYEYSSLWWKGGWPGGQDGVKASIGAAYERFDHVPDAKHDTNAKVGAKLEFPVREGVKFPLSVTWVNHKDLLSDEDEIVGHFGVSFDASGLFKKPKGS